MSFAEILHSQRENKYQISDDAHFFSCLFCFCRSLKNGGEVREIVNSANDEQGNGDRISDFLIQRRR
jgi:hypothetical protein